MVVSYRQHVLLDDATMDNWLGDYMNSRHGTLWGRLWSAIFFLIFATRFGNGGCRFIMSRPDEIVPSHHSRNLNRRLN
jgi:hypothetical protein